MQAYSQDLRERVLRALDRGERPTEMARRFEVSRVWVYQGRAGSADSFHEFVSYLPRPGRKSA